ncbi:hypothetical protein EST38_g1754 [Candolleomyces aberdarensis]|uniref:F-box domain-containing protein n=1 Tax=Candolleomyces aberdarensis TaxID=2316362 RepID=A0A4Q2DWM1_9AGAR|nr:hypothetical protein EST38_g1754 [Candolleomyces aberdarensis]
MFQRLPSSATSLELSLPAGLEDFGDEAPELHLPSQVLERLTTLDIECDWCDPAVLPQLKHCINVETLAIELSEVIIPETDEPVVFPQVRNLHLKYVAADSESQMLKFIKAPKMVNLEVRYRDSDDYVKRGLANPLLAFIKQSGCETTLRSLSLRDVDARVREMVKILVGLPSLTSLKLQRVSSTEDPEDYLFEQLTTRDAKGFNTRRADTITCRISKIRSELKVLENQLYKQKAAISALRLIPPEILGEIFELVLDYVLDNKGIKDLANIQLVCRQWRDTARITRRLWSSFMFLEKYDIPQLIQARDSFKTWFNRAGNSPKMFSYLTLGHENCEAQDSKCKAVTRIFASLLTEGLSIDHLWLESRSLQCFLNFAGAVRSIQSGQNPHSWDSIRSFTLSLVGPWTEPLDIAYQHIPKNVTSFQLYLPDYNNAHSPAFDEVGIPDVCPPLDLLERLTSFSLLCDWPVSYPVLPSLRHCTNLETLTVDFYGQEDVEVDWYAEGVPWDDVDKIFKFGVLLPKLHTLRLRCIRDISVLKLFNTPRLVQLDIGFFKTYTRIKPQLFDTVQRFVKRRSKCEETLRCFRLREWSGSDGKVVELANLLLELPSLTRITLDCVYQSELAFSLLAAAKMEGKACLPNLEVLEVLRGFHARGMDYLFGFLKSRRPYRFHEGEVVFDGSPDSLKRLTVVYQQFRDEHEFENSEIVQVLRRWCGVSVSLGPQT